MRPLILLALLSSTATPVAAEELGNSAKDPAVEDDYEDDSEILVVATRMRGQVDAPQLPVATFDEADIASYGATSIAELIEAISPQTGSGRGRGDGRPVILLNGQRISSFRQLRNLPPEAIRHMEVLPEEVALRFGYPPNQRVINFILKDNFASKTIAGEYNFPTRGGFANRELEGGLLKIDGPRRLNIEAKIVEDTLLTEAERNIIPPEDTVPMVSTDPDPAKFRSLVDDSRELTLTGTWSTGLGEDGMGGTLTLDGELARTDTRSLSGLDTVLLTAPDGSTALRSLPDPLERDTRNTTVSAGATLNKPLGGWQLDFTVNASHSDTKTLVDRKADLSGLIEAAEDGALAIDGSLPSLLQGVDRARSKDVSVGSLVTLMGAPFRMPAGEATLTVSAGFDYIGTDSTDTRSTVAHTELNRETFSATANIALPLTSRREGVLGAIGDLSLNFNAGISHLSDFGTLKDWNTGLTWSPTDTLSFQASYIVDEEAPSLSKLGSPEILSLNVPVFDFSRNETVLADIVTGGNPNLRREKQRDIKLSANWDLPFLRRSNLIVEYFRNRSTNVTQSFPLLTPEIEAAFPERVVRDASGRLVSIDRRPVTFSEIESSSLRWGFNLSGRLSKEEERQEGRQEGRQERGSGRGGPGFGRRGNGGRWNLSLYHTYRFTDRVTIAPDIPVLNQLDGDALTSEGVARHEIEMEGGVFHNGIGVRLEGTWTAPTTASNLRFGSTFDVDARIFINLGEQAKLVEAVPLLKGTRLAFKINNVFDSRQKVTDENGLVPLSYQAAYRDPKGRMIGIDIRKIF